MALYTTRQTLSSGKTTLSGDTIANVLITNDNYDKHGGAILINGDAEVTIDGATFSSNTIDGTGTKYGAAIGYNSTKALIINNTVFDSNNNIQTGASGNGGTGGGGAIYLYNRNSTTPCGDVYISGSTFINNSSRNGGAIYNNGSDLTIIDSYFGSNTATLNGPSIRNGAGTLTLGGVTFCAKGTSDSFEIFNQSTMYIVGEIVLENEHTRIINEKSSGTNAKIILVGDSFFTGDAAEAGILRAIDGCKVSGNIKNEAGEFYATDGYVMVEDDTGDIYLHKGEYNDIDRKSTRLNSSH